ncbi:MAG: ABC transporter ATP-binding protein [Halobacteriales archaeon]
MADHVSVQEDAGSSSAQSELIRVAGIAKSFGPIDVLENVSFDLDPGTVAAIVGPNGAGKTTLLRILAGLLTPDAGRVVFGYDDPLIGYVPQHPLFRSGFTVEETLRFYTELLGEDTDIRPILETVGLTGVADRRVEALSGGMVRLLGVAQALLGDPVLIVLDEPTGDLDPRMTDHIFETITALKSTETTIVLATHDLAGAARADQVLVLDRGRIMFSGASSRLTATTETESLHEAFLAMIEDDDHLSVRGPDIDTSIPGSSSAMTDADDTNECD